MSIVIGITKESLTSTSYHKKNSEFVVARDCSNFLVDLHEIFRHLHRGCTRTSRLFARVMHLSSVLPPALAPTTLTNIVSHRQWQFWHLVRHDRRLTLESPSSFGAPNSMTIVQCVPVFVLTTARNDLYCERRLVLWMTASV